MSIDFDGISRAVLARATELLPQWFPAGKFQGMEFCIGDISGEPGDSLKFNIRKGCGVDFATDTKFGDIIDLYAQHYRVPLAQAAQELADSNGIGFKRNGAGPHAKPRPAPRRRVEIELPPESITTVTPQDLPSIGRGPAETVHHYRDKTGRLRFLTARYPANEALGIKAKAVIPWVWSGDTWANRGPDKPRPLYGLETWNRLVVSSGERSGKKKKVLIVEGEKCADIAREMFPQHPVISWVGGASSVDTADWSEMEGATEALIWPDADTAGLKARNDVAAQLLKLGIDVYHVDLSDIMTEEKAKDFPAGWDIGDAVASGWSSKTILEWVKARTKLWEAPPTVATEARQPDPEPDPEPSQIETWERLELARKGNGAPYASIDNALRILHHNLPVDALHYDPFLNQVRYKPPGLLEYEKLRDDHILKFQLNAQRVIGIQDMSKGVMADALVLLARQRQRNSLQEWLKSLVWDGRPRLEVLFTRGFGAEDTSYHRDVSRCFLLGMVARALRPGCQVDTMPILEGSQGIGKSRGLAALAGDYYADIDSPIGSKEFCEQIQGSWLVELSELSAMRPSEVERVKSGISRTVDKYREPFAILSSDHPRQCVFAGSTNAGQYLQDDTGNRRFWPVACGTIDREWIRETRHQLFAEAVQAVTAGASWWDVDPQAAATATASRVITDSLAESVEQYCKLNFGDVSTAAMLAYWDIPKSQWTAPLQKRVAVCMRSLGYVPVHTRAGNIWRQRLAPADNLAAAAHGASTVTPIRKARRLGE